jgi:hypothetical protein
MTDTNLTAELDRRIGDLSTALAIVTEERDRYRDAADSLMKEADALRIRIQTQQATIDRLRLHLQQGVEL